MSRGQRWRIIHLVGYGMGMGQAAAVWVLAPEPEVRRSADDPSDRSEYLRGRRSAAGQRVLVVDDDADVRAMLRMQLEIDGYSVVEAADGDQAWRMLQQLKPALVLADIQMPGKTGLELCRLARAAGHRYRFVAFTAGMASWEECQAAGFDAHFLKTDPLPRLSNTIRQLLAG